MEVLSLSLSLSVMQAAPYFVSMILIEQVALKLQGKKGIRLNDAITSISTGLMMMMKE